MLQCDALCAIGAEKVLGNEIKFLGYDLASGEDREGTPGRVGFTVPAWDDVFRANLCLAVADRVFFDAASYRAGNFDALFDGAYSVPWQDLFYKNVRVVVDKVRSRNSVLASEHSVQSVVHKAICQKLSDSWRMVSLPETGATQSVRVYIDRNIVTLALDTSGEALHKRGYRTSGGEAPIRETLAASLLHLALWRRKLPLHDPFCGSGTILCEAAFYAYNAPPGFGRRFALEDLVVFGPSQAGEIRRKEAANIKPESIVRITGSDIDPNAVERARGNLERACVTIGRALQAAGRTEKIPRPEVRQTDFADLEAPWEEGVLLGNPPYGERLADRETAEKLYRRMASLFDAFPGWKKGFITSHRGFEEALGRKAGQRKSLKSGKLDTVFYVF